MVYGNDYRDNAHGSNVALSNGFEVNGPLNVPILTSDPSPLVTGDVWIRNNSGTYSLRVAISGTLIRSVNLT